MSYAAFDVVLLPFPYSDTPMQKRRPALVVSVPPLSTSTGLLWLAMITTAQRQWFGDVAIADCEGAGLPRACKLRAAKIATVDASRVVRRLGVFGAADRALAEAALRACAAF